MSWLYHLNKKEPSAWKDKFFEGTLEEYERMLSLSRTIYVGKMDSTTTEEMIHEHFSKCGEIKNIIMGVNRYTKKFCGFCFVEYYTREAAEECEKYLNETLLNGSQIVVAMDFGFYEGKQYGRGKYGGTKEEDKKMEFFKHSGVSKRGGGAGRYSARARGRGRGRGGYRGGGRGGSGGSYRGRDSRESRDSRDGGSSSSYSSMPAASSSASSTPAGDEKKHNPRFRPERGDGSGDEDE